MLVTFDDRKKVFDSVHREARSDLVRLCEIPVRIISLFTCLYFGIDSDVKCGRGVSSFFPVKTGMRQGCMFTPPLFNTCMDWVLGRVVEQSYCGAFVGYMYIYFFNDAVIFAESLENVVVVLDAWHEERKPLGLQVFWPSTKIQVFEGLLAETVQSVHVCDEATEIMENFIYLGSLVWITIWL